MKLFGCEELGVLILTQFIYGLQPTIENIPYLGVEEASKQVGGNTGNLAFCYALWEQLEKTPIYSWTDE